MPAAAAGLPPLAGLRRDAALFAQAYETFHPGLWRYQRPGDWARVKDRLDAELAAVTATSEADGARAMALWRAFARATAAVRCGHSYVNPYNQRGEWKALVAEGRTRLPFAFRWIDGAMIVTRPGGHPAIQPGTRILMVDGEPVDRLLQRMLPLARADGGNSGKRLANMSVPGRAGRLENFELMWRAAPLTAADVEVRLESPEGAFDRVTVALLRQADARGAGAGAMAGWTVRHDADATILTMPGWAVYNGKEDWRAWVDVAIDAAIDRGTKRLILDIRGNEGGMDCGDRILARMVDKPVPPLPSVRRVRFRETPPALRPHLDTWDPAFHQLGVGAAGPDRDGMLTLAGSSGATIEAEGRRLDARLIVLTDAHNSSATHQFATRVRAARLGTIVGEETGGNRRGINGGAFFFLRLPESGLELDLPLVGTFPLAPEPDAGIRPDVAAAPTPADLAAGTDRALAVARSV